MRPTTRRWSRATGARPTWSRTSSRAPTRRLKDAAQRIEEAVRRAARRAARRRTDRQRPGQHAGRPGPRARGAARVPVDLPALAAVLPLARRIPDCRRCIGGAGDRRDVLRAADRLGLHRLSVFALNFVTGLGLGLAIDYSLFMVSRYREEAATSGYGVQALQPHARQTGRTILFSSLTVAAAVASLDDLPPALPVLDGDRRRSGRTDRGSIGARRCSRRCWRCSAAGERLGPKRCSARADRDARPAPKRRLVPAGAVRHAPPAADRGRSARRC